MTGFHINAPFNTSSLNPVRYSRVKHFFPDHQKNQPAGISAIGFNSSCKFSRDGFDELEIQGI
ncbi:MAG TPA: hypothetical protein PL157_17440, partial [Acidobacteriota bacterium]|nr:hypothetical protein [Acidobacteriota bacterium]